MTPCRPAPRRSSPTTPCASGSFRSHAGNRIEIAGLYGLLRRQLRSKKPRGRTETFFTAPSYLGWDSHIMDRMRWTGVQTQPSGRGCRLRSVVWQPPMSTRRRSFCRRGALAAVGSAVACGSASPTWCATAGDRCRERTGARGGRHDSPFGRGRGRAVAGGRSYHGCKDRSCRSSSSGSCRPARASSRAICSSSSIRSSSSATRSTAARRWSTSRARFEEAGRAGRARGQGSDGAHRRPSTTSSGPGSMCARTSSFRRSTPRRTRSP